jgi:hypothetical protein
MKYQVTGAKRDTGAEITITIEARDSHDAEQQANDLGILVSSVHEEHPVVVVEDRPPSVAQPATLAGAPPEPRDVPRAEIGVTPRRSNSLGIASLVLGILALLICWIPFVSVLGLPLSGLGLLLALIGLVLALMRRGYGVGYPIAGGAISVVALVMASVTGLGMFAATSAALEDVARDLEDSQQMSARPAGEVAADAEIPEPMRPTREKLDWIHASDGAQLGSTVVWVSKVEVRRVELEQLGDVGQSENRLLAITLIVLNDSPTKKVEYKTWRGNSWIERDFGILTDNFDNSYKRVTFGFTTEIAGGVRTSESIYPGSQVEDLLVFEVPIEAAEMLFLDLPASNIGESGKIVFGIPASMIERSR